MISIKIPLKFVPKGPINNVPALFQLMAWRQIGDKPLSEPKVTQFNDAYIWVNILSPVKNSWHSAEENSKCILLHENF